MAKAPSNEKKLYEDMTPDEQAQAIRTLMEAGGSNTSTARELGTTPGTVAGVRYRKRIPSKNKPGFDDVNKGPGGTLLPRIPGLVEAKSEASRCEYKGARCPYEAKAGSLFCPLHQENEEARR